MIRYRLDARCPCCGERPKDLYSIESVEYARTMPPAAEFKNIVCRRGTAYRIPWGALANAEAVELRHSSQQAPWAA